MAFGEQPIIAYKAVGNNGGLGLVWMMAVSKD